MGVERIGVQAQNDNFIVRSTIAICSVHTHAYVNLTVPNYSTVRTPNAVRSHLDVGPVTGLAYEVWYTWRWWWCIR